MTQETAHSTGTSFASETESALVEELDRVLREAFANPQVAGAPAPVMREMPVMLPATGPMRQPIEQPPLANRPIPAPIRPAAHDTTVPSAPSASLAATEPVSPRRPLRPLPPVEHTAKAAPIEPISTGRKLPWRPAIAFTAVALALAVGGNFVLQVLRQQPLPVSDAPPFITAPATPAAVPADPQMAGPASVLPAPDTPSTPVAVAAAPASTLPLTVTTVAPEVALAQPPTVPVPPAQPVVESAGVLGEPDPSPFDKVMPSRIVQTVRVAAIQATIAATMVPAKPIVVSDPATWPPGASLAEPHPLPPRRK